MQNSIVTTAASAVAPVALKRRAPPLELVGASAPAVRAQKLFHEAREAALDHVRLLEQAIEQVQSLSEAVLDGGEAYDPGIREFARQMAETMRWKGKSLEALAAREAERTHSPAPLRLR